MATIKCSKQRDAIREYLVSTTSHPTAKTVYEHIQKIFPNISLGTVYRNLNFLVEHGQAIKLSCEDNKEHYDGNTMPHSHFYCRCCKQVSDMDTPVLNVSELLRDTGFHGTVDSYMTFFTGTCSKCAEQSTL